MARKSSIKSLPAEIQRRINELLNGGHTLDGIIQHLDELGAEVSRSALGRYSQNFAETRKKLMKSREMAQAFALDLGDISKSKLGRVIVELMQSLIFDLLMAKAAAEDGEYDAKEVAFISKAVKDLQSAMKMSAEMEMKIREDERNRTKVEAAKVAEKTAVERGLSKDTIEAIKANILGIK